MSERHEPFAADLVGFPVAADPENSLAREPLELIVTQFSDAVRRGEHPSIEDYVARHREWEPQIRELLPLIENLERWKADKEVECLRRSVPDEFPIRRLGKYELIRELGRGGMGIVFEAVRAGTDRHVAVKLLPWRFAAERPRWRERFHREAATIARLRHSHIVRVYTFGTHEGYCFYVMQLIEGVSLDWIIRRLRETSDVVYVDEIRRAGREERGRGAEAAGDGFGLSDEWPEARGRQSSQSCGLGRDSWEAFARIGLQVARALAHAHSKGVLHNDVKPGNLLLERAGNVIVTDFGLGRSDEDNVTLADEHPTGTLRYMAPERLLGHCDARSDVYSLGLTLYELATQTSAFVADDRRQVVEQILDSRFKPPRELRPLMPRALETIILNALAADPAERYRSAEALAADLARFIAGQKVRSTRWGPIRRAWHRCLGRAPAHPRDRN